MTNYNSDHLDRIEAIVEALSYTIDSNAKADANLTSLNAAVERLENLFSYLLRRDGENQDQ